MVKAASRWCAALFGIVLAFTHQGTPAFAEDQTATLSPAEVEEFLGAFPVLLEVKKAAERATSASAECRAAVCLKVDCERTHNLSQRLYLLHGEMLATQEWLTKARRLAMEHYNQLKGESDRKAVYRDILQSMLSLQSILTEGGKALLTAADLKGFLDSLIKGDLNIKEAFKNPALTKHYLDKAADATLDISSQLANLHGAANQAAEHFEKFKEVLPLPLDEHPYLDMSETLVGGANDAKSLLQGIRGAREAFVSAEKLAQLNPKDMERIWKEEYRPQLSKAATSLGQLAGKVLLVFSQKEIEKTQSLIDQYEALIAAEASTVHQAWLAARQFKDHFDALSAAIRAVSIAAAETSECTKSCPYQPPLRNPPVSFVGKDGKEQYLPAMQYYAKRVAQLNGEIVNLTAGLSPRPVDPAAADAPESCRQLASTRDPDPLADLKTPVIDMPPYPDIPARFCSIEEKTSYDKIVLTPAHKRAKKTFDDVVHYSRQIGIRLDKVKNAIDEIHSAAVEKPAQLAALERQRAFLARKDTEFASTYQSTALKFEEFVRLLGVYKDTKVEKCEAPEPLDPNYPHPPSTFCSEEEKLAMVAKFEAILERAGKQVSDWVGYSQELSRRIRATEDNILLVSLNKELAEAKPVATAAGEFYNDVAAQTKKLKAIEVGDCLDPCLVGSWVATEVAFLDQSRHARSGGTGFVVAFTDEGLQTTDYSSMAPIAIDDDAWRFKGSATAHITTKDGIAEIAGPIGGPGVLFHMSAKFPDIPFMPFPGLGPGGLGSTDSDNQYVCEKETLSYKASVGSGLGGARPPQYGVKLKRQGG